MSFHTSDVYWGTGGRTMKHQENEMDCCTIILGSIHSMSGDETYKLNHFALGLLSHMCIEITLGKTKKIIYLEQNIIQKYKYGKSWKVQTKPLLKTGKYITDMSGN
jgi:hypothetical protein